MNETDRQISWFHGNTSTYIGRDNAQSPVSFYLFLVFSNVVTLQQIKCENVSIVLKGTAIVQLICLRFHSVVPGSNPQHTMYNVSVKFCTKVLLLYPVWPDWTIFEDLGYKFSFKNSPNIWRLFGLLPKMTLFRITAITNFGQLLKKIWPLRYLATLLPSSEISLHFVRRASFSDFKKSKKQKVVFGKQNFWS